MGNTEDIGYHWTPIADLPERWRELASPELASFAPIWLEYKQTLQGSTSLNEFTDKMKRAWSIETGIIENTYTLDRGITQTLIDHGLRAELVPHGATDKPPEQLVRILRDHESVIDGVFDFIAQRRQLSTSYIKELQQAITRSQQTTEAVDQFGNVQEVELLKGAWKKMPNNPTRPDGLIHQYCPPEQVASEMDRLVELHLLHQESQVPPEVEASWLHHRFTQIHPFQDGNGRVARSLASLVLIQAEWFPLIVDRDARAIYIDALEAADDGDLAPLVLAFSRQQLHSMRQAFSLAGDLIADRLGLQLVLKAALEELRARNDLPNQERMNAVHSLAVKMIDFTQGYLGGISGALNTEFHKMGRDYKSDSLTGEGSVECRFEPQVALIAKQLGYSANTAAYHRCVRLRITWERQADIILSIHSLGKMFIGVLAATAFMVYRDKGKEQENTISDQVVLTEDVFQFSYLDNYDNLGPRFQQWLEHVTVAAMLHWREHL